MKSTICIVGTMAALFGAVGCGGEVAAPSPTADAAGAPRQVDAGASGDAIIEPDAGPAADPFSGQWVNIAAGTFVMGAAPEEPCRLPRDTQRTVALTRSFEMQQAETTKGEFEALMGYLPAVHTPLCDMNWKICPVEGITWHEAAAYCNALARQKGLTECYSCEGSGASVTCKETGAYSGQQVYSCPGYRLPTEAEWEYAYRAGTTTAYYNGQTDASACMCEGNPALDVIAWYCDEQAHPVARKQPNAWGLYDMAGNVSEWCQDWRGPLSTEETADPAGPASGELKVIRGGEWRAQAVFATAASRGGLAPEEYGSTGVRCVRSLP